MSELQPRSDAVAQHQHQVVSLLQDNGLSLEYNEKNGIFEQDSYRMALFKVLPCKKQTQHDWSCCPCAHPNERSRRRSLMVQPYLARVCPDMQTKGECPRGEACAMTHSMFEYWMHPQRYRTKMCREGAECPRHYCFFAHVPQELRKATHPEKGLQLLQPLNNACSRTQALPHAGLAAAHRQQVADHARAAPQRSQSSSMQAQCMPLPMQMQQQQQQQQVPLSSTMMGSPLSPLPNMGMLHLQQQQQQQVPLSSTMTAAPVAYIGMQHRQQQQLQQQQQMPLSAAMLGSEMSHACVPGVQQQQQQALQSASMLGDSTPLVNTTYARLPPPQQQQLSLAMIGSPTMAAMQPLQQQQHQQQFYAAPHPLQQQHQQQFYAAPHPLQQQQLQPGMLQAQQQRQQQHTDLLQPPQRQQQVQMLQLIGQPGSPAMPQLAQQQQQHQQQQYVPSLAAAGCNAVASAGHSGPLSILMAPQLFVQQTLPPVSLSSLSDSACIDDASLQLLQSSLQQQQLSAAANAGLFGPGVSRAQQLAAAGSPGSSGQLLMMQGGQAAPGVWTFAAAEHWCGDCGTSAMIVGPDPSHTQQHSR